jgi:hypothetical protein
VGEAARELVAKFKTLDAGLAELAPVLTIVEGVIEVVGDELVVVLPDEFTLDVLTELVGAVLLTEVDVPLPEPKEPPAAELDEKVITGEELVLIDVAGVAELEKLRVFDSVVTTVAELVAVD